MLLLWLFCPLSSHTNHLYKEVFSHISGRGAPCLSKPCASCLHGIWLLFENLLPKCLQLWLAYEATVVVRWNSVLMDHSTVSPCFTPAATPPITLTLVWFVATSKITIQIQCKSVHQVKLQSLQSLGVSWSRWKSLSRTVNDQRPPTTVTEAG